MAEEQRPPKAAEEAQAVAVEAAKAAARAAEDAKLKAKQAESYAREQATAARVTELAGKKDSCPRGTQDLWPELMLTDVELVAKIRSGAVDGVLSELLLMARCHPRLGDKPGTIRERGIVIEALIARGAQELPRK